MGHQEFINRSDLLPLNQSSWWGRNWQKLIALAFWLIIVGSYWWYVRQHGLTAWMVVKQLTEWFATSSYGPIFFIIFFALQPLIFFPSTLMGIAAGCLYGPVYGFLYTLVGGNGAGLVTYFVGRFFGQGVLESNSKAQGLLHRYTEHLRENAFEAILIMHLIFLPYDLVNYIVGFLRVSWKAFLAATILGSIPGMMTFVLFGASLEGDIMEADPTINWTTLAASGLMLVVSLLLSHYFKKRRKKKKEN